MNSTVKVYMHGYTLFLTCYACPEQYDVLDPDGKQVCYIRLRHGTVRGHYPDFGGKIIYESRTIGDGVFDSSERMFHLNKIIEVMQKQILLDAITNITDMDL